MADRAAACHVRLQKTVSATVTSDNNGTDWLQLREGGRYFGLTLTGDWRGQVILEVCPQHGPSAGAVKALEVFEQKADELYYLDQDADVRLWVRKGAFVCGEIGLELGT